MFNKILCPLDGSSHANRALAVALDMAKNYDAELVLLHVLLRGADSKALRQFAEVEGLARHVEPEVKRLQETSERFHLNLGPAYDDPGISSRLLVEIGEHIVRDAKSEAKRRGLKDVASLIVDGDPADQILRCVKDRDVDCVVMGSRGLSDIRGAFLGSVSHKVMNRAPCTCIAVK
jgi:nucleotide-binding universal stress UspA family protein